MFKYVILSLLSLLYATSAQAEELIIDLSDKTICIADDCLPVAVGRPRFRTPTGKFKLDYSNIFLNGFYWRCPTAICGPNSKVHAPHENPLGEVWINIVDTSIGSLGIHETPDKSSPLANQQSHGCIRMYEKDLWKVVFLIYQHQIEYAVIQP